MQVVKKLELIKERWQKYVFIFTAIPLMSIYNLKTPFALLKINPSFKNSGFAFYSKYEIFSRFKNNKKYEKNFLKIIKIKKDLSDKDKKKISEAFIKKNKLKFPLIFKPDEGARGQGLIVLENREQLLEKLKEIKKNYLLQEFCNFQNELGVFFVGLPGEKDFKYFGVSKKIFPIMIGDGKTSINKFLENHPENKKAVLAHLEKSIKNLDYVPKKGERLVLEGVTTEQSEFHYEDLTNKASKKVKDFFNKLTKSAEGINFGRYDIMVEDLNSFLKKGNSFKILELNLGPDVIPIHLSDSKKKAKEKMKDIYKIYNLAYKIPKRLKINS